MIRKILNSLSLIEKRKLILISVFTFFSILFELFGISLIIPIIKLIFDPNFFDQVISQYGHIALINNIDKSKLVTYIVVLFFLVYTIKTFSLTYLSYSKFKFINVLTEKKTLKLLSVYLNQNIFFHKKNHSSKLVKNLINEIFVLSAFFNSSIILISESVFAFLILLGIMIYDYQVFIILVVYSLIIISVFKIVIKDRVHDWGNERQRIQADITKDFIESFGGIKELIIYKKRDYFFDRIKRIQESKTSIDIKFSTINEIPKYFMELIALLGFLFIAFSLYIRGEDSSSLLVTLIFFSALFFKALPSVSRIINSLQQIKFYYPAHDLIHKELSLEKNEEKNFNKKVDFKESIQLNNIFYSYPDSNYNVLNNVTLKINKGDRVLIHGESGKGKSTLIDILSGFIKDYKGELLVDNKQVKSISNWRDKIGYLAQSFFILDDTIMNNIILNDELNIERLDKIIDICNLSEMVALQKEGLNTKIGERGSLLSGGEKQRIGLARALYRNPEILILDEPTSSLDENTANKFINSIFELDKTITIIMISHNESFKTRFNNTFQL